MTLIFTLLGCGSSGGVPRVGGDWGACDPNNPKNRRQRCSLLVQRQEGEGTTTLLIDTGPDLRAQLLDANVQWIDGVLYTHAHADHCHGIDDLRPLVIQHRKRIDVYADQDTRQQLEQNFSYCFTTPIGSSYPPILNIFTLEKGVQKTIDGDGGPITFTPFTVNHGDMDALGFRFENVVYLPDVKEIAEECYDGILSGLEVFILDALRHKPHVSHFNVSDALAALKRANSKRAILTNLHVDLDYDALMDELPDNIIAAYDGMRFEI
jgi:phosphoribosyl 1,2-cyclic phosphate phosphodiesterase